MKQYLVEHKQLLSNTDLLSLSNHVIKQDKRISNIESTMATKFDFDKIMDYFIDETKIKEITFLEGHKFEANEAYTIIYRQAIDTIYVIDNYVDFNTLSLLRYKQENVAVTIYTKQSISYDKWK